MKFFRRDDNMPIRISMGRKSVLAGVIGGSLAFAGVSGAHHSYAMFDMAKTTTLEGSVKEFQWTNPHLFIEVMASTPEGPRQYSIEGNNLRVLTNAGWKFNTLKPGDKVTVVMHPLRNGDPGGTLVNATLPDGRTLGDR
jgi:Family of unknown function (DUF6152)